MTPYGMRVYRSGKAKLLLIAIHCLLYFTIKKNSLRRPTVSVKALCIQAVSPSFHHVHLFVRPFVGPDRSPDLTTIS